MAVSCLFAPVMCALCCVVASRLAQIATGRQLTTGILLPVQREVNIRRRRSPGVLSCCTEAFVLLTCELPYLVRSECLSIPTECCKTLTKSIALLHGRLNDKNIAMYVATVVFIVYDSCA